MPNLTICFYDRYHSHRLGCREGSLCNHIVCPCQHHRDADPCDARTETKQNGRCLISQSVLVIATILRDLVVEKPV